ncbi:MAG: DciA family protein [Flavobacteriaceae bacterium]|nr:DciA family protein [Flavobacteriaceae bacterium]
MSTERKNEESPLSDVLKDFIKKNKLESGLNKVDVAQAWKDNMGAGVNNYTKKIYFENGSLHVSLSSSVLREELSYGKQKIINMLNESLGEEIIKKVVLH